MSEKKGPNSEDWEDVPTVAESAACAALRRRRYQSREPQAVALITTRRHLVRIEVTGVTEQSSTFLLDRQADVIDKMRLALSRGWTLAQYEYADEHGLWAAHAGDGTADEFYDDGQRIMPGDRRG